MSEPASPPLLRLTAQIVAAHAAHNRVTSETLVALIGSVYDALAGSGQATPEVKPRPAVPIKQSVLPEHIVCLEDGKKLKTLKRHLRAAYGLTPEQYRQRWGLPPDYPMVAPSYAARRAAIAKEVGFGGRPKQILHRRRKRQPRR